MIVLVCVGLTMEQPGWVCRETVELVTRLTASNVSISPPVGQFGAWDQNAGHTEH